METQSPPWAGCSNAWPLFQWLHFLINCCVFREMRKVPRWRKLWIIAFRNQPGSFLCFYQLRGLWLCASSGGFVSPTCVAIDGYAQSQSQVMVSKQVLPKAQREKLCFLHTLSGEAPCSSPPAAFSELPGPGGSPGPAEWCWALAGAAWLGPWAPAGNPPAPGPPGPRPASGLRPASSPQRAPCTEPRLSGRC